MTLDKIVVTILSIAGIVFTYWFFLMKKEEVVTVADTADGKNGSVDIVVEGGYTPDTVVIPKGKTTILNFFRKDPSSCLEEVVLGDFKIRKFLPLNEKTPIEITPQKEGEFQFSCGMNMNHGKIVVRG